MRRDCHEKQYIIAICIIAFFTSLIITMNIVKENKLQNTKKKQKFQKKQKMNVQKNVLKKPKQKKQLQQRKSISKFTINNKKYFKQCDHTINEYVEMPQELVNLTKEEVQNKYNDWKVIGFEPNKVTLYKEFDDMCGEHFKLKVEEGKIVIYQINKEGNQSIYEKQIFQVNT